MFVNIAIGLIIAVILLYDLVYLPFKHEADATAPKTAQVEMLDGKTGTPQDDAAASVTAPIALPDTRSEGQRVADVPAGPPASVQNAPADAGSLKAQLDQDQVRFGALNHDLADTRERLAQALREKAAQQDGRGAAEAAKADDDAKLDGERKRAADLAAKLTSAEQDAAAQADKDKRQLDAERARSADLDRDLAAARQRLQQAGREGDRSTVAEMETLRRQVEGERARASGLDRDLATARQLLAQAGTEKTASEQERRAAEAATGTKLQDEQKRTAVLAASLVTAQHEAAAQMQALQKQLDGEHTRVSSFDRDLATARQLLAQAGTEKTASEQERSAAEAAAGAKLQDEQKRAAELATGLVTAQHEAAAQMQALQKQLDGERTRATGLDHDLAAARQLLAQAGVEKTAGEQEHRAAEAAGEAKLQDEQKRAADLAANLATAEHGAAAQMQDLQTQLDGERARSAGLDRDLAGARERLQEASRAGDRSATAGMDTLRQQLDDERARSTGLDRDLAAARRLVAQAGLEKTMGEQERHTAEAQTTAKLQGEQTRAANLAARLAAAEQGAAQVPDLRKRLDGEQARSTALDRDLAGTREQLAQALSGKAAGDDERRALAAAKAADEAELATERKRAADLASRLATADDGAKRAPAESSPLTTSSIAAPPAAPATPLGDGSAPRSQDAPRAVAADTALPEDAPVRVVLHYSRGNQTARTLAASFKTTLQSRGLDVGDLISTSKDNVPDSVTYYYNEDQGNADRVAGILNRAKPVKSRMPKNGVIHPGTIDVTVAG